MFTEISPSAHCPCIFYQRLYLITGVTFQTHQTICSGLNYRSQGCQTGEMEASPPVIEWRMHSSASREKLPQCPSMAHVGVQCLGLWEAAAPHSPASGLGQVAGDVCVRDARAQLMGRTRVEATRALPAFIMALIQALLWLPLPIASLTLYLMPAEVGWAWKVMLITLSFTSLAPALAPAAFVVAARWTPHCHPHHWLRQRCSIVKRYVYVHVSNSIS